jgi:undecaprenyl diphosphate synthase
LVPEGIIKHMLNETKTVPRHLGLILDGNRRWAKANNLPTFEGHRVGYENLKVIGEAAIDRGVEVVTAYVFSTENWNRTKEEVGYLMALLQKVATTEVQEIHKKGIRVRFLGSRERIPKRIVEAINKAEELTKDNLRGTIALCLNYGGQSEIVDAVKTLIEKGTKAAEITIEAIAENLYVPDLPPVDLIIRTSGEHRISNFMLWRAAYSELYFCDKHWPDFSEADLDEALEEFANRERRFGG